MFIKGVIQLPSGGKFDYCEPENSIITIDDIAQSLSRQIRFLGSTEVNVHVSDHSCMVYRWMCQMTKNGWIRLAALLHDASETVTGDIPGPFKPLLPGFKEWERRYQSEIIRQIWRTHLNVRLSDGVIETLVSLPLIKELDIFALNVELAQFMKHVDWQPITQEALDYVAKKAKIYPYDDETKLTVHMARQMRLKRFMDDFNEAVSYCVKGGANV